MVLDTWMHIKERKNPIVNPLLWTYIMGLACSIPGAASSVHPTLPSVNYYTHGSQITVSHGHLAFFGLRVLNWSSSTSPAKLKGHSKNSTTGWGSGASGPW